MKIIAFFLLIFHSTVWSNELSLLRSFDNNLYNPTQKQVTSMNFKVRVSNLVEVLNQRFNWEPRKDVYFQVKWKPKRNFKIEVHGLPDGFVELKNELISLISNRIDFVVPLPLIEKFKGYRLSYYSQKKGTTLKAIDPSYKQIASEMYLSFDKNGILEKIKAQSPVGTLNSKFKFMKTDWSKGKYVLDEYVVSAIKGIQSSKTIHTLSYQKIKSFYFLDQLQIKTIYELIMPQDKEDKEPRKQEVISIVSFSDYEIK
jgi:hypothetical protein